MSNPDWLAVVPPHWHLRFPGWDWSICRSVLLWNEYRVPPELSADAVVVDVGAHVGSFTQLCLQRGAGEVWACEPEPDNQRLCRKHLAPWGDRVHFIAQPMWSSTGQNMLLVENENPLNTGGWQPFLAAEGTYQTLGLNDLLRQLDRPVTLLKLDCEGAEYEILRTADLAGVHAICGEAHRRVEAGQTFEMTELVTLLEASGFQVESQTQSFERWLFWAQRPGEAKFFV